MYGSFGLLPTLVSGKGQITIYTLGRVSEQIYLFHHYFYIFTFPFVRVYVLSYSE
jgi:hypothetical protein